VASAVIANPYTRVCFRLGDQDARRLADGFSFFDAKDLQNLGIGEAICRIERAEYDFNLRTLPLPAVDAEAAGQRRITAIERSRKRYARRREELEAELAGQAKPAGPAPPTLVSRHELQPEEAVEPLPPDARQRPRERKSPSPVSVGPVLPGRGGAQHKYLQALIQHWGEEQGFRATIEKQILDGQGSVDVALERQDLAIACEISISSNAEQELGNIQKCLAAGFAKVLAVITDKKTLAKTEKLSSSTLKKEELGRVRFSAPDNLLAVLEELAGPEAVREETVKGYRVKVQYRSTSAGEESAKKQTIARTILEAMKRLKGKR
jgi:hypothetical protein